MPRRVHRHTPRHLHHHTTFAAVALTEVPAHEGGALCRTTRPGTGLGRARSGEAQIASGMGISRGAVKSHTARAMAALRSVSQPGEGAEQPTRIAPLASGISPAM
jgi:hypothetical protein